MTEAKVSEPFPIFQVAHRYLLYDVNTVTYARRVYNISGVLIGGLPQAPQQNVFLGIPLELMPEEARLLVEKGVAYIADDAAEHKKSFLANGLGAEEKQRFLRSLDRQGTEASRRQTNAAGDRKMAALKKIAATKGLDTSDWNDIPDDMFAPRKPKSKAKVRGRAAPVDASNTASRDVSRAGSGEEDDESLFGADPPRASSVAPSETVSTQPGELEALKVTPTTSHPPLMSTQPPPSETMPLPAVPDSYPLYKHLHENDYFLAPGLRFGCQYMAYPGDPLRFHSHFLCNGMDWDEEFDLLDLVGGGRLGTGVKKGFLIGGGDKGAAIEDKENGESGASDNVRAFCVEWAGL